MKKVIIGIDPGTTRTGYGVLEVGDGGRLYAVALGDIDLRRESDTYRKLRVIFERVSELVERYRPDEMALEAPFCGKNPQSMLKLGRAQGVAMAAALARGVDVWEYAPSRVKQAVTGRGGASKEQVAALVGGMLGMEYDPRRLDATDGMAVALCHHFTVSAGIRRAASSGVISGISTRPCGDDRRDELPPQGGGKGVSPHGAKTSDLAGRKEPVRVAVGKGVSWEEFLRRNPQREIK